MCKSQPTDDKLSLIGAWSGHVTHYIFLGSNDITGTVKPKVVAFCTQVGYINSSNSMTCHQQNGRGYGHVSVLKLCTFAVMQRVARVRQRQLSYMLICLL